MENEILERLVRLESKLDLVLPVVLEKNKIIEAKVNELDRDVSFVKRAVTLVWTVTMGLVGIFYTRH